MEIVELPLPGLKLVKPRVFRDERGFFLESFHAPRYAEAGIDVAFAQDNHSRSTRGTLRGMHFQTRPGQDKLVRVVSGRIFDVAVDMRRDSPTFGRWHGVVLDAADHHQLYVPKGFAHGFCVLSESADVLYKVSSIYDAATEAGFAWDDPAVGIAWPLDEVGAPLLSKRDQEAPTFEEALRRLEER